MSYKLLTNLLFEPRGKHNPSLTYNIKDTVMSEDGSKVYFALDNVPAGIPLTDTNYWMLQMDLSASKNAMDVAAANARTQTDATIASANTRVEDMMGKAAEAVTSVADYATKVGMRVKGETKITKGNPMTIYPDGGSLLKPVTTIEVKQQGSGDPYPAGVKNLIPPLNKSVTTNGITFTPRADGKVDVSGARIDTDRNAVAYLMAEVGLPAGTYTLSGSAVDAISISIEIERASGAVDYFNADSGISRTFELDSRDRVSIYVQVYNFRDFNGSATVAPQLERGSVATEFVKHENIRPFISYDKLDLNVVGKNLIGGWVQGAVNSKGEEFSSSTVIRSAITKVGKKNVFVTVPDGLGYFFVEYADGAFLSRTDRNASQAFTLRDNTTHIRLCLVKNNGSAITPSEAVGYQVEYGTVGTEVEPYKGSLHTVQLDKTTYQGHYDWLTGKFRAEWVARSFDGTNDNWRVTQYSNLCAWVDVPELMWSSTFYSSHFKCYNGITGESDGTIGVAIEGATSVSFGLFFGIKGIASTVDEWKAYLAAQSAAGTPVQVVYKLATPIEIPLAPNVITAVEGGMNYIYGDADLTVEWVKPLETSLIEHSNAKVDANNEALLMDVAQKERSVGNPVVINDAVTNVAFPHVETVFIPKQSGSGDPYPAGGGKNLIDISSCRTRTLSDRTTTINGEMVTVTSSAVAIPQAQLVFLPGEIVLKAGTTYTIVLTSPMNFVIRIGFVTVPVGSLSKTFTLNEDITTDHIALDATEGQSINATFGICLRADNVAEYAPYSNIRPITGYDKLELHRTNENLCDSIFVRGTRSTNGVLATGDGYVCSTIKELIPVNPGMTLYLSTSIGRFNGYRYYFYNVKEELLITSTISNLDIGLIVPNDAAYFSMQYGSDNYANYIGSSLIVSLEPTVFVPYQGSIHTVQLGETVYGGRYNWLTGKLVAEWARVEVNTINTLDSWGLLGATNAIIPDSVFITSGYQVPELLCDRLKKESLEETRKYNGNFITQYMSQLYIRVSSCDTLEKYQEWIRNNPFYAFYKLATPIEIQLDPTRITTIPGTNTIFGDGEFTIDWFKSYKKVAEERENLLLDSFTDKAELSGNPIVMTPVGGISFDSVVTEFSLKQSGSGDPYHAGGGRNLIPSMNTDAYERNGIKFVRNADGSITVNGSATDYASANSDFIDVVPLRGKTLTIKGGGTSKPVIVQMYIQCASGNVYKSCTGANMDALTFVMPEDANTARFEVYVTRGQAPSNIVVYPQLELGDVSTSYAPYSNIRPITGYDKLDLNHAGKNLMPVLSASDSNSQGVEWKNNKDGSWTANGTAIYAAYITGGGMAFALGVLPAGEYKLNVVASSEETGKLYLRIGSGAGAVFLTSNDSQSKDKECTFVADGVTEYYAAIAIKSGETVKDYRIFPVLVDSSHSVYSINIGQTVYGGKFDWLTGKLVTEWALATLTGNETDWVLSAAGNFYSYNAVRMLGSNVGYCSHYKTTNDLESTDIAISFYTGDTAAIRDRRFTNVDSWKAYLSAHSAAGTPVQIAYKMGAPIEIQFTPSEIIALTGTNTLYGDGDTITAKFRQSKDVDILKRLSALETLMTNQTKGE